MYLDSAYIAKAYITEPDSAAVRLVIGSVEKITSSWIAFVEVTSVFQRHIRQKGLTSEFGRDLMERFWRHTMTGTWNLIPVTEPVLQQTARLIRDLPPDILIRAGDAIHLATALSQGETEIWTNDRHLLRAADHVGLIGRTV